MREELTYRNGYNKARQEVHDSSIRNVRWNLRTAIREIKRANKFYTIELQLKVRDYHLSRIYGILSSLWVTTVISEREYVYWNNVANLCFYHNSDNRLTTNDIY